MEATSFSVVMIDDEPGDIERVRRYLEKIPDWDIRLLGFPDWPKARTSLLEEPVAPLLLDYHLGNRNGLDLVSAMRASGDGRPLILLTGVGDESLAIQAMRQGADDYLDKNALTPDNLLRSLAIAMTQARLRQEKIEAETALKSSEKKFRTFFETSPDGVVFVDMEGRIQEVNAAYLDMLGYTLEEVRALTYFQLTPSKWHAMEEEIVRTQILQRGYADEYEKEYIRKEGTVFPITLRVWLQRGDLGQPCGMWGLVRDITARKQAEAAVHSNLAFLQALIEAIPLPVFFKQAEGPYLGCNTAFATFLGIEETHLMGRSVQDLFPEPQALLHLAMEQEFLRVTESRTFETSMPHANGTLRDAIVHMANLPRTDHGSADLVGVIEDVTDLRNAVEALKQSAEEYRSLFESSQDGIVFTTMEGQIHNANPAYIRMLGYSRTEILGMTYQQLTPPEWRGMEAGIVRDQIIPRGYSDEYEKEYIRKDGTAFPIRIRTWLCRDKAGQPSGMWAIVRDLTTRPPIDPHPASGEER